MKRIQPSRREFLEVGAAALGVGGASSILGRAAWADAPAQRAAGVFRQGVASARLETGEAARDILEHGGNAVDAAAAAVLVECVIEPWNVGLGGYGGSLVLYRAKTGRVHTIDSDSRAPRKFDAATFNPASALHGYLAVGPPGIIAGIDLALREYGTLPFKRVAASALALAENGIRVTPRVAASFELLLKDIDPVSRRAYFPQGVPAAGGMWVQADLARLIRRLGDEGPGSFYTGDIASAIVKQVQANGGVLSEEDFRGFHATEVAPLHINYRGYDLYTPPPPSGGLTSLSILKTLEQFDLPEFAPWGAKYVELFAGASNLAWEERFQHVGDPDFVAVPLDELLSETRAKARAQILRQGTPTTPARPGEASHTVNVTVIDKQQNIACWTATHGEDFGSHVAIEGLGLMLGHGMSRFDFKKTDPNYPAPGKRPQHNMAPMAVLRGEKPFAALGMPGGRRIVTFTAQMAVNLIDFNATPQQAVSAPRIHTEGHEPIEVTSDLPAAVVEELKRLGHRVQIQPSLGGKANAVVIDPKSAAVQAAGSGDSSGVLTF